MFRIKLQDGSIVPTTCDVLKCCSSINNLLEATEGLGDQFEIIDSDTLITRETVVKGLEFCDHFNKYFEEQYKKVCENEEVQKQISLLKMDDCTDPDLIETQQVYSRKKEIMTLWDMDDFYVKFFNGLVREHIKPSEDDIEQAKKKQKTEGEEADTKNMDTETDDDSTTKELDPDTLLSDKQIRDKYLLLDEMHNLARHLGFEWLEDMTTYKITEVGTDKDYTTFTRMFEFAPGCLPPQEETEKLMKEHKWLLDILRESPIKI